MKYLNARVLICITLFVLQTTLSADGGNQTATLKRECIYQKAELYKAGSINIINLEGTYRQMGRQYGALVGGYLKNFHRDILKLFIEERGHSLDRVNQYARDLFSTYPWRFKEIIHGMAETSGLNLEDHLVINAFEHYLFNPAFAHDNGTVGCSAIATWGSCTKNRKLIFGRNYDFGHDVALFKKYLTVAVFNPLESAIPVAIVTFCGTLNATTVMNSKGLFLELNNGGKSAGFLTFKNRISAPIELFALMLDSSTMNQLDAQMHTVNTGSAFIINIADSNYAQSYEWAPFGIKKIPVSQKGYLVSTNHFIGEWDTEAPDDNFYLTVTRRKNLLMLAEKNYGRFNPDVMKSVLATPIEKGGATSYNADKWGGKIKPYTAYQVIALPHEKSMMIRIPSCQEWVTVDLKKFFRY